MNGEETRNPPRTLSQEQTMQLTEVQNLVSDFVALCSKMGKSRELSLAVTNVQQAGHWARDHILGVE